MKKIILSMCFISISLTGCISTKSFIDPTFPKLTYDNVVKREQPLKLNLTVEFQRNGEHLPKVDSTLRDSTDRILRASGIISPANGVADGEIKVIVNNIADTTSAAAKGFGTGLTFGLVGTTVTDAYEMSVTIMANGKTVSRMGIKHAIHTTIGNATIPNGIETIPPATAFPKVLEQMLLRALQDMQKGGELSWYNDSTYLNHLRLLKS